MNFATVEFLVFFALVCTIYRSIPARAWTARKLFLFAASLAFYASWSAPFTLLMLYTMGLDFAVGRLLPRVGRRACHALLVLSLLGNLGMLAFFKYGGFLYRNLSWAGVAPARPSVVAFFQDLALPLGISFYTFHTLSYVIDVYRGQRQPCRNPLDFGIYVAFFPQLAAGPILRAGELLPQLVRPSAFVPAEFNAGLALFAAGLAKKVLFADVLAVFLDPVFAAPSDFSPVSAVLALYAYAFQIYFDFSGYTDMALGLAQMLGFRLVENFDAPYVAVSITDFWRRWHMSLSRWLRDYLYIPLGGSRGGRLATYRNLMATMLVGGLWHGAGWNFVLWGGYHGGLLALERALGWREAPRSTPARVARIVLTFHLVLVGWFFFRIGTVGTAREYLEALAGSWTVPTPGEWRVVGYLAVGYALHLGDHVWRLRPRFERAPGILQGAALAVVVILMLNLRGLHQPFVYFQF